MKLARSSSGVVRWGVDVSSGRERSDMNVRDGGIRAEAESVSYSIGASRFTGGRVGRMKLSTLPSLSARAIFITRPGEMVSRPPRVRTICERPERWRRDFSRSPRWFSTITRQETAAIVASVMGWVVEFVFELERREARRRRIGATSWVRSWEAERAVVGEGKRERPSAALYIIVWRRTSSVRAMGNQKRCTGLKPR